MKMLPLTTLLRTALLLGLLFGLLAVTQAGERERSRARAALALAQATAPRGYTGQCHCTDPSNCVCPAGQCKCPQCLNYRTAYHAMQNSGQPMVLYVGCSPLPAPAVPGYVLCSVDKLGSRTGPCVLIVCPDGTICEELRGRPASQDIELAVQRCKVQCLFPRVATSGPPMPPHYPMLYQPQQFFMPSMGGFGGGGFGGVGGGC